MAADRRKPSSQKRKSESKPTKGSALKPREGSFKKVSYKELSTRRLSSTNDAKFLSKLDHLKRLAAWASGEASIPSLGAYLGHLYSATAETRAAEPDPSIFSCGRCETILHPGKNCTVRVEKNQAKRKHSYKNNVVYRCDFCSHATQKRGARIDYYKRELIGAEEKPPKISKACGGKTRASSDSNEPNANTIIVPATPRDMAIENSPANPSVAGATPLLEIAMSNEHKVTFVNGIALPATAADVATTKGPANTSVAGHTPLLDAMKRRRTRSQAKLSKTPQSNSAVATANGPANTSKAGHTPLLDAMKRRRTGSQTKLSQTPQRNSAATNVEGTANSSVRKKRKQPKTMWEGLKNKFDQIDRQSKQSTLNLGHRSGKPFLF